MFKLVTNPLPPVLKMGEDVVAIVDSANVKCRLTEASEGDGFQLSCADIATDKLLGDAFYKARGANFIVTRVSVLADSQVDRVRMLEILLTTLCRDSRSFLFEPKIARCNKEIRSGILHFVSGPLIEGVNYLVPNSYDALVRAVMGAQLKGLAEVED